MTDLSSLPIEPGTWVAGKYRTERLLGQGGMGAVVLARDATGQPLAIKFLLPSLRDDGHFVARFRREAEATARLSSEHVPRVLDVGSTEQGAPFIVMEYCEGRDLRDLVKEEGPLSEADAAAYIGQACVALAEAHALGIIHRDLKPSNLLLGHTSDGKALVKVLDFGVAKVRPNLDDAGSDMTATGTVLGSRLYMAPEQMRKPRDVDARADIWALGVCLYYLVTGHTPFEAATVEEVILAVVMHPPRPLRAHAPRTSPAFEAVVLRCLEKSPRERFGSVTELVRALAPLARAPAAAPSQPRSPSPNRSVADAAATEASLSEAPTRVMDRHVRHAIVEASARLRRAPPPRSAKKSRVPLIAAISLALGVVVGLAALGMSGATPPSATPPPPPASPVVVAPTESVPLAPVLATASPAGSASALAPAPSSTPTTPAPPVRPSARASTSARAPAAPSPAGSDSPW